jgi:hypothetical protein
MANTIPDLPISSRAAWLGVEQFGAFAFPGLLGSGSRCWSGRTAVFQFSDLQVRMREHLGKRGVLAAATMFRELPKPSELAGATLMIIGVSILVRERHSHLHVHEITLHEHLHVHDEHQ